MITRLNTTLALLFATTHEAHADVYDDLYAQLYRTDVPTSIHNPSGQSPATPIRNDSGHLRSPALESSRKRSTSPLSQSSQPAALLASRTLSAPRIEPSRPVVSKHRPTVRDHILLAAARFSLSPALIHAVISVESSFDPGVRSPVGALGLMQLMPRTATMLGIDNPLDSRQNILGGARYLRKLLNRFHGDLERALAAYNAGPTAVVRYGGLPPYAETTRYVARVLERFHAATHLYQPRKEQR